MRIKSLFVAFFIFLVSCSGVNTNGSRQKLYFAHPLNTYNTALEAKLLLDIKKAFPDWEIENPNQKSTDEGVKRWIAKSGNAMDYFTKELLPVCCNGGVFLPLRSGEWSSGVWLEAQFLGSLGYPLWKIDAEGKVTPIRAEEMKSLSLEETRRRLRDSEGRYRPY